MNFGDFKTMVAAFLARNETDYTSGTFDFLSNAVNMARKATERLHDFNLCRVKAQVTMDLVNGVDISTAVLASDGTTAVSIKSIRTSYLPYNSNANFYPVRTITKNQYNSMMLNVAEQHHVHPKTLANSDIRCVPAYYLVRDNTTLFVTPNDTNLYPTTTFPVQLDVVKWLDDYTQDSDTDFLLDTCSDYMLFKTVALLEPFMKEDVRMPLIAAQLKDAWKTVLIWDGRLIDTAANNATRL